MIERHQDTSHLRTCRVSYVLIRLSVMPALIQGAVKLRSAVVSMGSRAVLASHCYHGACRCERYSGLSWRGRCECTTRCTLRGGCPGQGDR